MYSQSAWRNRCAPIIAQVLRETQPDTPERRKALHDAYPFGMRKYHPYKVWLSEIKRQLERPVVFINEGQKLLFPDAPMAGWKR